MEKMTVGELVAQLDVYPDEMAVEIWVTWGGGRLPCRPVGVTDTTEIDDREDTVVVVFA